jgi:hypothetical protein
MSTLYIKSGYITPTMSTRSSMFYASDDSQNTCHIYWELAERIPGKAAPIYIEVEAHDRRAVIRLPVEIATKIRDVLEPKEQGASRDVI